MQRLTPEVYVGGYYRFHTQTGASFFTTLAGLDGDAARRRQRPGAARFGRPSAARS